MNFCFVVVCLLQLIRLQRKDFQRNLQDSIQMLDITHRRIQMFISFSKILVMRKRGQPHHPPPPPTVLPVFSLAHSKADEHCDTPRFLFLLVFMLPRRTTVQRENLEELFRRQRSWNKHLINVVYPNKLVHRNGSECFLGEYN